MALFTESEIIARYDREYNNRKQSMQTFSAKTVLNEGRIVDGTSEYDIFLSHSSADDKLIAGLKLILQDLGYKVYVDFTDTALDSNNVTPNTAATLRKRMAQCKSLLYAFSENASNSKWMPWELGYFDALKNSKVAVLPISHTAKSAYKGSEFVGLYYVVQINRFFNKLCVHNGEDYVIYSEWLKGQRPYKH